MTSAPPTTTCARHPRRPALAACVGCGDRLCADCIVQTRVGFKCGGCTGARARTRAGINRRRVAVAVVVLAAVVAAAAAASGLLRAGGEATGQRPAPVEPITAERTIRLDGAGGVRLAGTLQLPASPAPAPGVLIIPGFGPTDRNGVAAPSSAPDPLYRDIAASLADAGLASFRYDKRGTGQSVLPPEEAVTFDDLVADAGAGVSFLAERADVDPDSLALVGHDEGGLIALRLAAADPRVRRVVLVSTPGRPLVDVLADDLVFSTQDPARGAADAAALRATVARFLADGSLPEADAVPPALRPVFGADRAYLEAIFSIDPATDARAVDVPVLVVLGAADPGVSEVDAERLVAALTGPAEVVVSRSGGHTLAVAPDVPADAAGTDADGTHAPGVHGGAAPPHRRDQDTLERIADWLAAGFD